MKHILFSILIVAFFSLDFKQTSYKLGEKVQDFSLVNALDNSSVSLKTLDDNKGVVIIFINRECPYSKIYESRIISLSDEFRGNNVKFILISTGQEKASSLLKWATEIKWDSPVLLDSDKAVAKKFNASKTPEAFVLKNMNGSFYIKYKGAIDDNPQTENHVRNSFLKEAITAIINDGPIKVQEKRATGCIIR